MKKAMTNQQKIAKDLDTMAALVRAYCLLSDCTGCIFSDDGGCKVFRDDVSPTSIDDIKRFLKEEAK